MQNKKIWALAVIAASLILFAPVLFGGHLFSGFYVNLLHYFFFAGQKFLVFELNQFPSWWPAFSSGYPISLTLDGFLNPIFLVALWKFPVIEAYHWLTYGFFMLNIYACYLLARALKLSPTASILAATVYGFSGIMIRWTDVIVFTALYPLLPLTFLTCLRISEGRKKWQWIFLLLLVYGWIGGFSELLVYDLIALGGWCLYLIFKEDPRPKFWSGIWDGCKKFLWPVIASVILVSPWLISILFFITNDSVRAGGLSVEESSSMPIGIAHFVHIIFPRISVTYGGNIPFLKLFDDIDLYIGTSALILLLLFPFMWKKIRQMKFSKFFVGLFAFAILMAFRSPLYLIVHEFPVINWFRWHFKWLFLATFAGGILAGYALDAITEFRSDPRIKRILQILWIIFGLITTAAISIAIFGTRIADWFVQFGVERYSQIAEASSRALPLTTDYYAWIIRIMADSLINEFSFNNSLTAGMLFLWILTLAVFTLIRAQNMSTTRIKQLILAVSLLSTTIWTGFLVGFPRSYLTEQPKTAKYIHQQEKESSPFRIFWYFPRQSVSQLQNQYRIDLTEHKTRALLTRELLADNTHIWFNIDSFFDHEPLGLAHLENLRVQILGRDDPVISKTLETQITHFSTTSTVQSLGESNVKYVLSPHALPEPWKHVFTNRIIEDTLPVYIYKNPFFKERWGFAETINDDKDTIEVINYTAGELHLKTHTESKRILIFRESEFPFWSAYIDEKQVPITIVGTAFQSIEVPEGEHEIKFKYAGFWEQAIISFNELTKRK